MSKDQHADNVAAIKGFFDAVLEEARTNSDFASRLAAFQPAGKKRTSRRGTGRRSPAVLDPFALHEDGADLLREQLGELDLEQLKDIVAEYGMDRTKLAMRWKTTDRLIELILETVDARIHKGDAFRDSS